MQNGRASAVCFDTGYPDHETGRGLATISAALDLHREFGVWITEDMDRRERSSMDRAGLPCEVILRCGILKHLWQADYCELEFVLADSTSARRFTRIDLLRPPKRSALQPCLQSRSGRDLEADQPGPAGDGPERQELRRRARCASTAP